MRRLLTLVCLIGIGVVAFLACTRGARGVESRLAADTRDALDEAGYEDVDFDIDGRLVELVSSRADGPDARQAVRSVPGVLRVTVTTDGTDSNDQAASNDEAASDAEADDTEADDTEADDAEADDAEADDAETDGDSGDAADADEDPGEAGADETGDDDSDAAANAAADQDTGEDVEDDGDDSGEDGAAGQDDADAEAEDETETDAGEATDEADEPATEADAEDEDEDEAEGDETGDTAEEADEDNAEADDDADASNEQLQASLDDVLTRARAGGATFPSLGTDFDAPTTAAIDEVAVLLELYPDAAIEIGGHTDDHGEDDANQSLSEARASVVKTALIERGIAEGRLVTRGYGESQPIESNLTFDGQSANRRVEFTVLNGEDQP